MPRAYSCWNQQARRPSKLFSLDSLAGSTAGDLAMADVSVIASEDWASHSGRSAGNNQSTADGSAGWGNNELALHEKEMEDSLMELVDSLVGVDDPLLNLTEMETDMVLKDMERRDKAIGAAEVPPAETQSAGAALATTDDPAPLPSFPFAPNIADMNAEHRAPKIHRPSSWATGAVGMSSPLPSPQASSNILEPRPEAPVDGAAAASTSLAPAIPWSPPVSKAASLPLPTRSASAASDVSVGSEVFDPTLRMAQLPWQECPLLVFEDAAGNPIQKPSSPASPIGLDIQLQPPFPYWEEGGRWIWHKKRCLPQLSVRVMQPPVAAVGQRAFVMVSAGTLLDGRCELSNQGLEGECRLPLEDGQADFSSLLFHHSSFNCGKRAFHLVITVLTGPAKASAEQTTFSALACFCSGPIQVDGRQRRNGNRPGAVAYDMWLKQPQYSISQPKQMPGAGTPSAPMAAPAAGLGAAPATPSVAAVGSAAPSDATKPAGLSTLVSAMGIALMQLNADLIIMHALSSSLLGYQPAELHGQSLLSIVHHEEHSALTQTTQALVSMCHGVQTPNAQTSLRMLHRIITRDSAGCFKPAVVDSNMSLLPSAPGRAVLLFSARFAAPTLSPGEQVFRVFPTQLPALHSG